MKLRIGIKIIRNFFHAKPKPRLPVRIRFAHGAFGRVPEMMLSVLKCVGAHVREWELPLNKRNSSSGRMMVSKRGVSHHAPDSYLRHTRGDSGEEGVAPGPRVHCTVMLYIRYLTLELYL